MWHRDVTWQCVMSSVTDRVPSGGGGSRGRFYSLMSALMKEVIVTTETKWQVITQPNLLNKARLYRAQRDFEVEQNGGILTLSVRRDERVFVSLNFDVWLYANRFTVNMFNSNNIRSVRPIGIKIRPLVCLKLFIFPINWLNFSKFSLAPGGCKSG